VRPKPVAQPKKDDGGGFHPLKSATNYVASQVTSRAAAVSDFIDENVRPSSCQGTSLPGVGKECVAGTFQFGASPNDGGRRPLKTQVIGPTCHSKFEKARASSHAAGLRRSGPSRCEMSSKPTATSQDLTAVS
jgi:hypothetical protein